MRGWNYDWCCVFGIVATLTTWHLSSLCTHSDTLEFGCEIFFSLAYVTKRREKKNTHELI